MEGGGSGTSLNEAKNPSVDPDLYGLDGGKGTDASAGNQGSREANYDFYPGGPPSKSVAGPVVAACFATASLLLLLAVDITIYFLKSVVT